MSLTWTQTFSLRVARCCTLALVVTGIAIGTTLASADAQTKVRYVEVVRNLAYLPSYFALAKGYFKEEVRHQSHHGARRRKGDGADPVRQCRHHSGWTGDRGLRVEQCRPRK